MLYRRPKANAIKRAKAKASVSQVWATLKDILRDVLNSTIAKIISMDMADVQKSLYLLNREIVNLIKAAILL
jgi:hypothetical protein